MCTYHPHFICLILSQNPQPEEVEEAKRLSSGMVHKALAMDGTCTGEHGVGLGKIKYLEGAFFFLFSWAGWYGRGAGISVLVSGMVSRAVS